MSHMSCKAPHKVAHGPAQGMQILPARGPGGGGGWTERDASLGSRQPPIGYPLRPPLSTHLDALLQAAPQLLQALSGGAAGRAAGEGPLHVGGSIPQAALDTVALVELIHLRQVHGLPGAVHAGARGPTQPCTTGSVVLGSPAHEREPRDRDHTAYALCLQRLAVHSKN